MSLSARAEEKSGISPRADAPKVSPRASLSARGDGGSVRGSARSVPESGRSSEGGSSLATSRSSNPAIGRTVDTARTYMDTGRVHIALAALGAEKQALLSKLQQIDSALEAGAKKKAAQSRPRK
mmetsp:Transcript_25934/g.43222  ORF Transcript_25934/g.43222 Transcript_25934/m.43222 type:complete len:124 (-) Transcript_25934:175-546(-)|eukprot:CAMPEP_0174969732 /NCGR_PEP_ID=MMETSP0004_2-20121128/8943_1 /TAXON_ID=420556 /ORGANISM="Ochromonas sp., Strain CCMP1393" /LENGTH=123 /DNA_ID=CAMNT_0016219289 /DNA_START=79 /DNA_END=450 /DNA_ORIENTATION=+